MSRTLFHPRAILSVAALTVALLGTAACSDSTGPSNDATPAIAPQEVQQSGRKPQELPRIFRARTRLGSNGHRLG